MKLYHYPHCPFCQRVRLALGAKKIAYESIIPSYADAKTPTQLVGKKILPIVVFDDGEVLAESVDIIQALDNRFDHHPLFRKDTQKELTWVTRVVQIPRYFDLLLPHYLDTYKDAPEFDEAGTEYFRTTKEQKRGTTFTALKAERKNIYEQNIDPVLNQFRHKIEHGFIQEKFSAADCVLAADLSGLRIIPEIALPSLITEYIERAEDYCGDDLLKF